ncbi:MAG TPA: hypothetical protein VNO24_25725 [Blastocatellia bacterium]|nr:hypothetical protein [Blastocatellia bacterium]
MTAAQGVPSQVEFAAREILAGQLIMQVAVLETVTRKLQLASVFCDASFAVQLTVVTPTEKLEPEGGLQVIVTLGQPLDVGFE